MTDQKYKIIVGGIVTNKEKNKILLVTEKDEHVKGLLNLPIGGLEKELIQEGAEREIREETGITVKIYGIVGIYANPDRQGKNVIKVIYAAQETGGKLGGELECRWYTEKEFNELSNKKFRDGSVQLAVKDFFKGKIYPLGLVRQFD